MGWITDLLQELPLSAVQRERLSLAEQKYALLETANADLKSKYAVLESENNALKIDKENLRQEIQRRDDVVQKEKSHGKHLEKETENTLKMFVKNPRPREDQIAQLLGMPHELAMFHIGELDAAKMVVEHYDEGTFWALTHEGRKYLASHGLIS